MQTQIRAHSDSPPASTEQPSAVAAGVSQRPWLTVALAGLLAGAGDLIFALVFYGFQGATPARILRGIAAGLLGHDALTMGSWTVALGAALHFFTAVCAAFVFYGLSRRVPFLTRRWALSGAAFGVGMFLFMHFIVIPLSRLHFHLPTLYNTVGELGSHIFLFGMVIAFGVARARAAEPASTSRAV